MTQLSYASTPLPTTGESRSTAEQSLAAIFLAIQTAHNATDSIVAAATQAGAASSLVMTTASGGIVATGGLSGTTGTFSGNVGVAGTLNVTGAAGVAGALGVTGALTGSTGGFSGAVTAPAFHGPADSLAAPLPFTSTIADFKATPGAAGQIAIAAGAGYEDSNGAYVPASGAATVAAQTVTLPAQPSGTNVQYVAITLAPTNGSATTTTAATLSALNATPIPTANRPVCVIVQRGVTTNPTNVTAASDILEMRGGGGTSATGGGGGGGGSTTAFVPTIGAPASSGAASGVNLDSILRGTASGTVNGFDTSTYRADPLIVKSLGAGQAGFDTIRDQYIDPRIPGLIAPLDATHVQLVVPNGQTLTVGRGGLLKTISATISSGAVPGSPAGVNPRYLLADLGVSGTAGFTLVLSASANVLANQVFLATIPYDGANLRLDNWGQNGGLNLGLLDRSPLVAIDSNQVALDMVKWTLNAPISLASGTITNFSNYTSTSCYLSTVGAGSPTANFEIAYPMRVRMTTFVDGTTGSGAGDIFCYGVIANTNGQVVYGAKLRTFPTSGYNTYNWDAANADPTIIAPAGINILSMTMQISGTGNTAINAAYVALEFWKQ